MLDMIDICMSLKKFDAMDKSKRTISSRMVIINFETITEKILITLLVLFDASIEVTQVKPRVMETSV